MTPVFAIGLFAAVLLLLFGAVSFIGAPYVPSQRKYIRRIFRHLGLGRSDVVVDVGSGDGIVLRVASEYGARAVGYEINPLLVVISKLLSRSDPRVSVVTENFWYSNLPEDTTIVYAFSVSRDEPKLVKLLQKQADRLERPLKLLCLGSPLRSVKPVDTYDAYHLYLFQPLQVKKA